MTIVQFEKESGEKLGIVLEQITGFWAKAKSHMEHRDKLGWLKCVELHTFICTGLASHDTEPVMEYDGFYVKESYHEVLVILQEAITRGYVSDCRFVRLLDHNGHDLAIQADRITGIEQPTYGAVRVWYNREAGNMEEQSESYFQVQGTRGEVQALVGQVVCG